MSAPAIPAILAAVRLLVRIKAAWTARCNAKRARQDAAVRHNGGGGV